MDISKISVKKIRELIVFTAFLVVALWKFDVVLDVLKAIWGIAFPFVLGGAIAFVTNVPMSFLEKKIFGRAKKEDKIVEKLARPISLFLTIVFAVGVIVLVMFGVIPQLTRTMGTLMMSIADFIPQMQSWIREFSHNNQEIMKLVDQVQFNPDQAIKWGISLLGNGAGNMMNTTMSAVGSIVSGLAAFFVAFSCFCAIICFACACLRRGLAAGWAPCGRDGRFAAHGSRFFCGAMGTPRPCKRFAVFAAAGVCLVDCTPANGTPFSLYNGVRVCCRYAIRFFVPPAPPLIPGSPLPISICASS